MKPHSHAEALAADLAGARVDPNEAQKALAYLRSKRDPKQYFDYLKSIVNDGSVVIRSGQTLGYYRELLAASERHLRGLEFNEMAWTLGWAIRLLRYYRAVPDTARDSSSPNAAQATTVSVPPTRVEQRVQAVAPSKPQLPTVGDNFTGKITAVDESAVLIEIEGFLETQATGVLGADAIPDGRTSRYRAGNAARVEVTGVRTLKSGRTLIELKPAPRDRE